MGMPEINTGDTAWLLMSAALVLLMTPGLAFFYGGLVSAKSVLNMMMMIFGAIGIVSVLWVLYGYAIAFGDDGQRPAAAWPRARSAWASSSARREPAGTTRFPRWPSRCSR